MVKSNHSQKDGNSMFFPTNNSKPQNQNPKTRKNKSQVQVYLVSLVYFQLVLQAPIIGHWISLNHAS